jgi:fibronectin-binding autotransporter adhesin
MSLFRHTFKNKYLIISLSLFSLTQNTASAEEITWTGDTSTDWSTALNWSPKTVPTALDTANIGQYTNTPTVSNSSSTEVFSINFSSIGREIITDVILGTTNGFTGDTGTVSILSGGTFKFTNTSGATIESPNANFTSPALGSGATLTTNSGYTVIGSIDFPNTADSIIIGEGGALSGLSITKGPSSIAGVISNTLPGGSLEFAAPTGSVLTLSGNNTYTGKTILYQGIIQVSSDANLGIVILL